ncbi:ABC transporter permease [Pseudonocardia acaciae]|uniref:ABC transporter permease n=1 Tax=Pseudonocardia acaciae TaxID=551276 RepID=UPI001FE091A2|nr:ABC transporter permease [Pseudonocardia acaciae]
MSWPLRAWVAVVALLLLAPTVIVIPMSFSDSATFKFPPEGFSLRWYERFFSSPAWLASVGNSLKVAVLVAVVATALGTAAALGLDRTRFRGRGAMRGALLSPMIVPIIVVAIAVYAAFLRWHLVGSLAGFVLAHTALAVPFVVVTVTTNLAGYDRTVETASASLGAGPLTTLRSVTLPLLLPGILSGFVFAFVTSFDEVVIALFLQSPTFRTLPVQMYESVSLQTDPTISAAASLVVVVTTGVLLLIQLRGSRSPHGERR